MRHPAGPGDRVVLAVGAELEVDAIFAGVFEIAGEQGIRERRHARRA